MNLIKELGVEKCKRIVEGAPEGYRGFNLLLKEYVRGVWFSQDVSIADFKAQIDQHYYGQSEEKELEQYALLSQEKIEGGAVFIGDNSAIVQAMRNITDDCSDIRNHISPATKVIER